MDFPQKAKSAIYHDVIILTVPMPCTCLQNSCDNKSTEIPLMLTLISVVSSFYSFKSHILTGIAYWTAFRQINLCGDRVCCQNKIWFLKNLNHSLMHKLPGSGPVFIIWPINVLANDKKWYIGCSFSQIETILNIPENRFSYDKSGCHGDRKTIWLVIHIPF